MVRPDVEKFLKERFEKEAESFRVHDSYTHNYKTTSMTKKFYSKYEKIDLEVADPELVKKIKNVKDKGPKETSDWPMTENQWFVYLENYIPIL